MTIFFKEIKKNYGLLNSQFFHEQYSTAILQCLSSCDGKFKKSKTPLHLACRQSLERGAKVKDQRHKNRGRNLQIDDNSTATNIGRDV